VARVDYFEREAKKRQASGLKQNRGTVKEILPERDKGQSTDKAGKDYGRGEKVREVLPQPNKGQSTDKAKPADLPLSIDKAG